MYLHTRGTKHEHPGVRYRSVIDIGFTGFIQFPLSYTVTLSLPLESVQKVILANDSTLMHIQEKKVREAICTIMEGGSKAFEDRYRRIALRNDNV